MYKLARPLMFLMLIGSFIEITSCNDGDEDGLDFEAAEIQGTWNYDSFSFEATINGVDFLEWFADLFGLPEDQFEDELDELGDEFNEFEGLKLIFADGGVVTATSPGEAEDIGTWTLNEDAQTLILNFDGEELVFDVVTLNSNNFIVSFSESGEYPDIDEDGMTEVLEVTMIIGMTK